MMLTARERLQALVVNDRTPLGSGSNPAIVEPLERRLLLSAVGWRTYRSATPAAALVHITHAAEHRLHPAKHSSKTPGDGNNQGQNGNGNSGGGSSKPSGSGSSGSGTNGSGASGSGANASSTGSSTSTGSTQSQTPAARPPSTLVSAPDITSASTADEKVTVRFTGSKNIDGSAVRPSALILSGPVALNATDVQLANNRSKSVTAVFTIPAPAGGWTAADNGLYTLSIASGAATDTSGNPSGRATGSFTINIPLQPGAIDPRFGGGQSVTPSFAAEAVAAQDDGKVILAGHEGDLTTGKSVGVLERLNSDGSIDTSFGNNGQVITNAGSNDAFYAVAISGGSIIAAGGANSGTGVPSFLVTRYSASGTLDQSFAQSGRALIDFGGSVATAYAVAVTGSGGVLAAGASDGRFAFAGLTSSGALDSSFGQSGRQLFALSSGKDTVGALALQSDGKILAAGASSTHIVALRLSPAGEADNTFGFNGLATLTGLAARQQTGLDHDEAIALDSTGRILVGNRTAAGHFGLVRLDSSGNLDSTFGAAGLASAALGTDDEIESLVPGSSGQIFAVGTSASSGTASTGVADFDANGNLVSGFGKSGLVVVQNGTTPAEVQVGSVVTRSFGVLQAGALLVGSSSSGGTASPVFASNIRRIVVASDVSPGGSVSNQSFGLVNGKVTRAVFTMPDKTKVTLTLTGGSGTASEMDGRIRVLVTAAGSGAAISVRASGGSRHVTLDDVTVRGSLRSFSGTAANLAGTLFVDGAINRLTIGQVTGTIAAGAGQITSLTAAALSGAKILSGANLGGDGELGGSGTSADQFNAGTIGSLRVTGMVTNSIVAAGLDPSDPSLLGSGDTALAGTSSVIKSISVAGGVDASTRFLSGAFGKAHLSASVTPDQDPHFIVLPPAT